MCVLLVYKRTSPEVLQLFSWAKLVDFLVCFLGSPTYIRNPYIRGKLVEVSWFQYALKHYKVLCSLIHEADKQPLVVGMFTNHALTQNHLVSAILHFYIDVEFTGSNVFYVSSAINHFVAHTQFYDKFRWRRDSQQILKFLWSIRHYRSMVAKECR